MVLCTDSLTNQVIDGIDVCMEGRTDGKVDGYTDTRMKGWMDEQEN